MNRLDSETERANPIAPVRNDQSPGSSDRIAQSDRAKRRRRPHTRVIKACTLCRRQKTRCLKSENSISCLRCLSLSLACSFEDDFRNASSVAEISQPSLARGNDDKERSMTVPSSFATVSRSGSTVETGSGGGASVESIAADVRDVLRILKRSELPEPDANARVSDSLVLNLNSNPVGSIVQSPLSYLAKTAAKQNAHLPSTVLDQLNLLPTAKTMTNNQTDVISVNLLSYEQATKLLNIFRDRYGRWISFPDDFSTAHLLDRIRQKCPLLLTIACTLSLKYSDPLLKNLVYDTMLVIIKKDLEVNLANMPNTLEFLQCLIILSIYSVSLSSETIGLRLDAWYLSHLGIHLFIRLNNFGLLEHLYDPQEVGFEFNELTSYRVFNTLILIHMAYTILSGKLTNYSMQILKPKKFFQLNLSTNFDYRIIAEIEIYLIAYRYLQLGETIESVQRELKDWFANWNYVFNKSANEFVEIDYHLTQLLICLHQNHIETRTDYMDFPSIQVFKTVHFHTVKILSLISSIKDDSYFAFLSDQIHLIVVFNATITLKTLRYNERLDVKDQMPQEDNIRRVARLIHRYKKLSTSDIDSFYQYSVVLENALLTDFPNVDLDDMDEEEDEEKSEEEEGGSNDSNEIDEIDAIDAIDAVAHHRALRINHIPDTNQLVHYAQIPEM